MLFGELYVLAFLPVFYRDICTHDTSVDITEGVTLKNGTIKYNETLYSPKEYIFDDQNGRVRGCVCLNKKCYRKCCKRNEIASEAMKRCVQISHLNVSEEERGAIQDQLKYFEEIEAKYGLQQVVGLPSIPKHSFSPVYKNYRPIRFLWITWITSGRAVSTVDVNISETGKLHYDQFRNGYISSFGVEDYCVDVVFEKGQETDKLKFYRKALFTGIIAFVGFTRSDKEMLVSVVFIFFTLVVHLILPEMRKTLHGLVLVAHLCCIWVAFIFMAVMGIILDHGKGSPLLCLLTTCIIYFSSLSAFFWLNVMCFDIWRTFSGKRGQMLQRDVPIYFRKCCIYAFGVPMVLTIIIISLELLPDYNYIEVKGCFLMGKTQVYMYIPVAIICTMNIILFLATTIKLACNIKKNNNQLRAGDSAVHSQRNNDKQRLIMYLKLFFVMGIYWIFEVLSQVWENLQRNQLFWKIMDSLNGLSGLFIFIIVVCKKEKLKELKKRFKEIFKMNRPSISKTTVDLPASPNEQGPAKPQNDESISITHL